MTDIMKETLSYISETYHELKSRKAKKWRVISLIAPIAIFVIRIITIILFY